MADDPGSERRPVPVEAPGEDGVPAGNLFSTPKLTALDPADKDERQNVERLLEALDRAE